MEIHEKSRPRICDRYLVISLRSFEPFSISLSLYPFVDLSLIYLAISLFPEASGEEKNRCAGPHARTRARALALSSPQVQYPWMSVDLVTHIIVKRGLNSNPSRAAGRAYRTIPRCSISIFIRKCSSLLRTDLPRGNFLVLVQRDTNVVDGAGKQSDAFVGNGISGLTRSRGILGEGALYRRSLSLLSSFSFGSSVSFRFAIPALSFPFYLSLTGRQLPFVRPLRRGERRDAFSQGVRGSQQRKMRFSKRRAESEATAKRRFWTAA